MKTRRKRRPGTEGASPGPRGGKHGGRGAGAAATIRIMGGWFSGLLISIDRETTLLGSGTDCHIRLDHSFVSPEHATISRVDGFYVLEDLNSRHGTSIGGHEIHRARLKSGDRIGIGDFVLLFHE